MWTELHWTKGPWPGRLALAARPRGGDWLDYEITAWAKAGVDSICSLLTPDEEENLGLLAEERVTQAHGLQFFRYPIPDRQVPASPIHFAKALAQLTDQLDAGRNLVLHCRQGSAAPVSSPPVSS